MNQKVQRCLKIDDKWVNLILTGNKSWEIRRTNTRIRERIALGNTKIGRYVGYATLIDSLELTVEELKKYNDKHQANDFIEEYAKGRKNQKPRKTLFAWVLKDVIKTKHKRYSYSTGSWCQTD
jgi:hypothetical protein